ncbi:LamB/YcsF family protein [Albirhodobacter sp. R86504]|uniref:LamB/YcsF family protein n=1 Tax=Albirhodobacter sp. R86504 TaxID=3093848 RepID=UPI0036729EDE
MTHVIDINADLGEGFGPWEMGDDAALLQTVTSANIACGFHAGDPDVMARTMDQALRHNVALGAHPGFADLKGFGRRQMTLSAPELTNLIQYQLGAAIGMARARGARLRHFKLHGALSNMAMVSQDLSRVCFAAALALQPDIRLLILPRTAMEAAAVSMNATWSGEIFADRGYRDDGTLIDRRDPNAVLHDPIAAADRIKTMIRKGAIISASGKEIPARIETICVHGDTASAVDMARHLRKSLTDSGITVQAPPPSA